jgi:hypothetical protein
MDYDDNYDFGFTEISQEDVDNITRRGENAKLEKSMKLMLTFLNNLKKNPEKEYLHWPDRAKKVDEFIKKLKAITE